MINIPFISIATIIITSLLNKENEKRAKRILIVIFIATLIVFCVNIINEYENTQFIFEIFCYIAILYSFIKNVNIKKIKINLSKQEKILLFLSIAIGIGYLITCICSNNRYILPYNKYGEIENCYFNADVHRATMEMFDISAVTNQIHPLYRFIMLPISLPIILINFILNGSFIYNKYNLMNGYIVCIMQIIFNSISTILIYRILKHTKINEKLSFMGSILFIFSITSIWLSIIPETYSVTLLTLLLMFYFYIKNNKNYIIFAVLSLGANLMCILPIGIILLDIFVKNRKKLKTRTRKLIYILAVIILIISIPVIIYLSKYLYNWADKGNILIKIQNSINQIITPFLLGPKFINIKPYFVQSNYTNIYSLCIITILSIIAIIGAIYKRKEIITKIGVMQIIAGLILHIIVGYGANNGIIYTPLYSWAFIIFIIYGFDYINKKTKKNFMQYILGMVILMVGLYNIFWIKEFRDDLALQEFELPTGEILNSKIDLHYSNGNTESFYVIDKKIIQVNTGKTIVSSIDTYTYNEKENCILGVFINSKWFKLEIVDDEIVLNVSEKYKKIEKEKFYIFGMGLRDKYILKKDNKYKLIEYNTGNIVLDNLKIDRIHYDEYKVYAKDENNNEIIIYENEDGIYINRNNQIQVLQDNVKINIPSFENYEHKYQLKQLFNEIMVNITKEGPKPNFIAYENAWYRDSAIVAMVLEKTNNINQIEDWILSLDKVYDMQNKTEELDNIGQVLYLASLTDKKNNLIIEKAKREIEKNVTEEGYLNGLTDEAKHPVYQTKWLIYGLKKLGLDYTKYKIPDIVDSYSELIWFDEDTKNTNYNCKDTRWEYIQYAYLHYNNEKINFDSKTYPLSTEYEPSKANFENMKVINGNFARSKLIVPHSWAASEMFLYLIDLDEGKIK